jgi:ribonuclease III
MIEIPVIEAALGIEFNDKALLQRAMTHRSYLNENHNYPYEDNERLEFLGDAIMDAAVGEYLYHHYPEMHEGQLTSLRAALVRTSTLAKMAEQLHLGQFLLLSKGEEEMGGRHRPSLLCDSFEALIGAMYLDRGYETVCRFILPYIQSYVADILLRNADKDAKSRLQELSQEYLQSTPYYRLVAEDGPPHAREFTIAVIIKEEDYGQGRGHSKQMAEQAAAQEGLSRLEFYIRQNSSNGIK